MSTLQEKEGPLDQAIVNSLIEATPEWWKSAVLEVDYRPRKGGIEGYAHTISSPEGHRDVIHATDEMCSLTYQLAQLFREYGRQWVKVVYKIEQLPTGAWNYAVEFSY